MRSFEDIFAISADRHGGPEALEARLAESAHGAHTSDDRWLAGFTQAVFSAGFNWKVIQNKWPGFEDAFWNFEIGRCAMMSEDDLDTLVRDTRIVRNAQKILTVRDNAVLLSEIAQEHGSATSFLRNWPSDDFIGLLDVLKTRGSRLGGTSAQYALRFGGIDSFILGRDVGGRLVAEGVIDKAPSSKKAMKAVQDAFNTWADQSGRSLTEISRVLALSTG